MIRYTFRIAIINWILTGILFCIILQTSLAQQSHKIDSLKHVIKSLTDDSTKVIALTSLGKLYWSISKYEEAKKYFSQAFAFNENLGPGKEIMTTCLKEAHFYISAIEELRGHYKTAFDHYQAYREYGGRLYNESRSKELARLKEQYESEKKDKEIELLNKEKIIQVLAVKKQKQTKNFLLTGLALFSVMAFFIYRNYDTRQELKLQTLRNKIASDLHDDVGSTLSSISIISQMAQAQSKEVVPALEIIGENSRKMLDAMTDIVWAINPENDQFEKIIMRMRTFVYELFGAKQIEYEFIVDDDASRIKLPMQTRKNLYLIFKEAANNLVKYADANKAMIAIKRKKDSLSMMIRDNGKGFDITNEFQGNGLNNMRKRAAEIGAQLSIDSIEGSGTTINLELPV